MTTLELKDILSAEKSALITAINEFTQMMFSETPDRYVIESFTNYDNAVFINIHVIVNKSLSYKAGFKVTKDNITVYDYRGIK